MEYNLVRSKRRRRGASLSVNQMGQVIVRAPLYMPRFVIDKFVNNHANWIAKRRLALASPPKHPRPYFTRARLKLYINKQVDKYSASLAVSPSAVRLTNASSYWGSCSPRGLLSFSVRLTLASPLAVQYVVVHELAHLKYRGHGPQFWQLVNKTFPKANEMRHLLRQIARD